MTKGLASFPEKYSPKLPMLPILKPAGPGRPARKATMEQMNYGRIIDFKHRLADKSGADNHTLQTQRPQSGQALILEPRTIRHQERVEDLFYLLFRRTGS